MDCKYGIDCEFCSIGQCKNPRCGARDLKIIMDKLSGYCSACFIKSFLCEVCGRKRCQCKCMERCSVGVCSGKLYNICLKCGSRCKKHYLSKQCNECIGRTFCPACGEIKNKDYAKHAKSQRHKNNYEKMSSGIRARATIPKAKKMQIWLIFNTSDLKGRCWCCRSDLYFIDAEMGHIVPHAEGGGYESSNLVPLCSSCNKACSDRNLLEYRSLVYPDQIYKELAESKIDNLTARLIQDNHGGTEYNPIDLCEIYRINNSLPSLITIKYIIGIAGKITL